MSLMLKFIKTKLGDDFKVALFIILANTALLAIVAWFRFAIYDERLFLHETVMISEILKAGEWIGNYGIGVHGFLFKLPVALVFLLTGPSIYLATLFHVILSSIIAWIFFLLSKRLLNTKNLMFLVLFLLIVNYSYVSWSTTFHREIPVLFSVILFIYIYTGNNKYRYFWSAVLLMLVIDAKEYVFFMILPALGLHLFILEYVKTNKFILASFKALKNFLFLLLPAIVYLILMFYTNLVPINMFNASFLSLTTGDLSYQIRHTLPETALSDLSSYTNTNILYSKYLDGIFCLEGSSFCIAKIIIIPLSYLEKFFYISNFSLQGIPLAILIPSLLASVYSFKVWLKRDSLFLFCNLFYWSFLLIYLIRTSHQRYLFPIIPLSLLFFVLFFFFNNKESEKFRPYLRVSLILMTLTTILSFLYQDMNEIREVFNVLFTALITILLFFLYYFYKYKTLITNSIIIFVAFISILITWYALLFNNQIYKSSVWGINGEANKIAEFLEPEDIVFVDCASGTISEFTYLINFYRANNYLPIEWKWELDRNKISRDLEKEEVVSNLYYYMSMKDIDEFQQEIYEKDINKIVLLKSEVEGEEFPLEENIDILKKLDWLVLKQVEDLKNKQVFIFEVVDSNDQ